MVAANKAEVTATLDVIELPRETLHSTELSASHAEFSHADLPFLDDTDIPRIPKPTAAITTEDDPVEATFEDPTKNISGREYDTDRVNIAVFKLEEIKTLTEANGPWHDLDIIEESDIQK